MNKMKKNLFSPTSSVVKRGTVAMLCLMLTKSLLLVFTLLGSVTLSLAQNTIVNDYSSWAVVGYSSGGSPPHYLITEYEYFDGDSIIGEHSYKKMFWCRDQFHETISYEGLMREENQKIYFKRSDTERLIYDFSLEEGMIFEYNTLGHPETLYVKSVDSIEINGSMKKRIQITGNPDAEKIRYTWIEEIGSLDGILSMTFGNGGIRTLLCYFQNEELVYKNPDYSECYYEGYLADLPVEKNGLSVYPNPTSGELRVTSDELQVTRIEIFDIVGKMVYGQAYEHTIDISFLSTGLYFLKVYDTNEQVTVVKIIKR